MQILNQGIWKNDWFFHDKLARRQDPYSKRFQSPTCVIVESHLFFIFDCPNLCWREKELSENSYTLS